MKRVPRALVICTSARQNSVKYGPKAPWLDEMPTLWRERLLNSCAVGSGV